MMSEVYSTVTWSVARAGGWTAFLLLTLAVAVGLLLSAQLQSPARWPRLLNNELHNFLSLLSTIFVGIHVLAIWLDPYIQFSWSEIVVPFISQYRPAWMGLGIVALYLGLAIGLSTWLRPRIGYSWWRRLHVLTIGVYILATLHGIGAGSDTQTWWAIGLYTISALLIGILFLLRLIKTRNKRTAKIVHTSNKASTQRLQRQTVQPS